MSNDENQSWREHVIDLAGIIASSSGNNITITNSNVGSVTGSVQGNQVINDVTNEKHESNETLGKVLSEIQEIVLKLQSSGSTQEAAENQAAQKLAEEAKQNPSLQGKLVNWGVALASKSSEEAGKVATGKVTEAVIIKALTILGLSII